MSQFTLYENVDPVSRETYPYFVDIQNGLLSSLNTRLVIPLTPSKFLNQQAIGNLCPVTTFTDVEFVLLTHQMTNVPIAALKSPVGSLGQMRDQIVAAIEFLVTGI